MKQAAKIILINPKNKVLLYLRDNKKGLPYAGYWDFIGGQVEKNESAFEAIQREVKEEIGVDISNIRFLGNAFFKKGGANINKWKVSVFIGGFNMGLEQITLTEGQKLGFFTIEEIECLKFPHLYKDFVIKNKKRIFK